MKQRRAVKLFDYYNNTTELAAVKLFSTSITTCGVLFATSNGSGDTERMRITNGGPVGIGTTSPGSLLQVNGNAAIGYSTFTTAPSNGLLVSGNVEIGTTSTSSPLTVNNPASSGTVTLADLKAITPTESNPLTIILQITRPYIWVLIRSRKPRREASLIFLIASWYLPVQNLEEAPMATTGYSLIHHRALTVRPQYIFQPLRVTMLAIHLSVSGFRRLTRP